MKLEGVFFVVFVLQHMHAEFVCPIDAGGKTINGAFRDPFLCNVYYQCVDGTAYPQQCPPLMHFKIAVTDCQYFVCIPAKDSGCTTKLNQMNQSSKAKASSLQNMFNGRQTGSKTRECLPNLNSTVPSSSNPNLYYNCNRGIGWIQQCPPDTKFNPIFDFQRCSSEICRKGGEPLPINGGWSQWSFWSNCSSACGDGSRERRRFCNNPPPSNGGQNCRGRSTDIGLCNSGPCAIDKNPAFMVSLKETTEINETLNWTMINLNHGGMFESKSNSIRIKKPGLYFFSMTMTSTKGNGLSSLMKETDLDVGILLRPGSKGPDTFSRIGLYVLSNTSESSVQSEITTQVYSSEQGKETCWLGFHYDSDNYLFSGKTTTVVNILISWSFISAMRGFENNTQRTEFKALTGGWYMVSMGMKAEATITGLTTDTELILEISNNNTKKLEETVIRSRIRNSPIKYQFSRSFLIHINEDDVFRVKTDTKYIPPVSGRYIETYMSAFKLKSNLPHFMAYGNLKTCSGVINIGFPNIKVDSTYSWDNTNNQYLVKKAGRYYIEFSFEPGEILEIRMYLNGHVVAVAKKDNANVQGYILTRSILLDLDKNVVLSWRNFGCLSYLSNPSSLTIIYVSEG